MPRKMRYISDRKNMPFGLWVVLAAVMGVLSAVVFALFSLSSDSMNPDEVRELVRPYCEGDREFENFVMAVIRAESSLRPEVVSHAGATGLMQIMPDTAEFVARLYGEPTPSQQMLKKPDLNIRYGIRYLKWLRKEFGKRKEVVLAAYNAGPAKVRKWLAANQDKDAVTVVKNCPYKETRVYISRVMRHFNRLERG
ncbi:MAG: lytic transglycosylase domain-containing protein [Planctomycetota bacterium]|nr:lytic transglycosylase domain-containing protein [Planctomycetota bacterium]